MFYYYYYLICTLDKSRCDLASLIVVEKRNGSLHIPIGESSREFTAIVVPTSPSCLENTVVINKSSLDESITTDITAGASDGDNTDGCDEDFVGVSCEL